MDTGFLAVLFVAVLWSGIMLLIIRSEKRKTPKSSKRCCWCGVGDYRAAHPPSLTRRH